MSLYTSLENINDKLRDQTKIMGNAEDKMNDIGDIKDSIRKIEDNTEYTHLGTEKIADLLERTRLK